jgi:hypothetical protein
MLNLKKICGRIHVKCHRHISLYCILICPKIVNFGGLQGSGVLTAVVMKNSIFWDITPCSPLEVNRSLGVTHSLHLQGCRVGQARNKHGADKKQSNIVYACGMIGSDTVCY